MDRLIKTLPAIIAASGDSEEVVTAACFAGWKEAAGEVLSSNAIPVELQGQVLVVAVADAIWQKQLERMRAQLLFRLNSMLGKPLLKLIEFRIDAALLAQVRKQGEARDARKPEYVIPFELMAAASEIRDAELRRAFLGAASSCIKRVDDKLADENENQN